jgi:TolB-like protein
MSDAVPVTTSLESALPATDTAAEPGPEKKKKKKSKVRSAWISFIGRILAQICGAIATVVLGLQLVRGYFPDQPPAEAAGPAPVTAEPIVAPQRHGGAKVLAVLPVTNYSGAARNDAFSDGLTEALIAELAQVPGLHVTSRTSSMHFRDKGGLLPSIARQLGADYVLESSVVAENGRRRVVVQLIDAVTDLHVWVRRYESTEPDALTVHSTIAGEVARDVREAGLGLE